MKFSHQTFPPSSIFEPKKETGVFFHRWWQAVHAILHLMKFGIPKILLKWKHDEHQYILQDEQSKPDFPAISIPGLGASTMSKLQRDSECWRESDSEHRRTRTAWIRSENSSSWAFSSSCWHGWFEDSVDSGYLSRQLEFLGFESVACAAAKCRPKKLQVDCQQKRVHWTSSTNFSSHFGPLSGCVRRSAAKLLFFTLIRAGGQSPRMICSTRRRPSWPTMRWVRFNHPRCTDRNHA